MPTRRQLLSSAAAAATAMALPALADDTRPKRNLLLVLAAGGWDVSHALDPKPGSSMVDVPAGQVEMFGDTPIYTDVSRPAVSEFFSAYGSIAAVINGIDVRSIVHPYCRRRVLTGTADDGRPDVGAICGYELGIDRPVPYLVLAPVAYPGPLAAVSAQLGMTKQIKALIDPADAYPGTSDFALDAAEEQLARDYLLARIERERATRGSGLYNKRKIDDLVASLESGDQLRLYGEQLGPRGIALTTADQLKLAADAIERGLSHSVITQDSPGRYEWDTHDDNAPQSQYHDALFAALRDLADDLASRPGRTSGAKLLDDTVVAVMSEMSRTPKLNAKGGKDHWPVTSMLVFGAGVAGGRAYGATDDEMNSLAVDFTTGSADAAGATLLADNVVAGLLELCGVKASTHLPNVEVFRAFAA